MARISSYPRDLDVVDQDSWMGTSVPGLQTRNFTAEAVAKYLNIKGKISVSAQMIYKFEEDPTKAGAGDFYGVANGTAFSAITSLNIHVMDKGSQNVVEFMTYLIDSDILISEQNGISIFGHYKVQSYTDNGDGFYTLTLGYIGGSGVLTDQDIYDIANFTIAKSDKTFEFDQGQPALVWTIQHNLNKFPSVSVVDTANTVVNSQVNYVDKNNITINNTAQFAGKAYLN